MMLTLAAVVRETATVLLPIAKTDAHFEAECLVADVLKVDRLFLKKNPEKKIDPALYATLQRHILKRKQGIPLAYIIGKKAFWTFEVTVTPDVLVPRSETECLVETVLTWLPQDLTYPVVELGTGSGIIAIALAKERPRWRILATDQSLSALEVAQANAKRLGCSNITFYQGDWFLPIQSLGPFAAIISNPPYIASSDPHLLDPALKAEPRAALCSGKTGLEALSHLIKSAKDFLIPQGILCFEHGHDQSTALFSLLRKNGYHKRQQVMDLGKQPRVIVAEWPGISI